MAKYVLTLALAVAVIGACSSNAFAWGHYAYASDDFDTWGVSTDRDWYEESGNPGGFQADSIIYMGASGSSARLWTDMNTSNNMVLTMQGENPGSDPTDYPDNPWNDITIHWYDDPAETEGFHIMVGYGWSFIGWKYMTLEVAPNGSDIEWRGNVIGQRTTGDNPVWREFRVTLGEKVPTSRVNVYLDGDNVYDAVVWTHLGNDLTPDWGFNTFYLYHDVAGFGAEDNDGICFDNLSMSDIPEPATIGLLAIGGLAMLRRRRR